MIGMTCFIVRMQPLGVHRKYSVPILLGQLHDTSEMRKADVVIDHIDPSINIHARLDHATDVVMAGHVGTDCVGHAIFLANAYLTLSEQDRRAVRAEVRERLSQFEANGQLFMSVEMLIGKGQA